MVSFSDKLRRKIEVLIYGRPLVPSRILDDGLTNHCTSVAATSFSGQIYLFFKFLTALLTFCTPFDLVIQCITSIRMYRIILSIFENVAK